MSATQLVGDMEVLVPMAGLIDKKAEAKRLDKEIEKRAKDVARCENKLNNERFINSAPTAIVEQEKTKLEAARSAVNKLKLQLDAINQL